MHKCITTESAIDEETSSFTLHFCLFVSAVQTSGAVHVLPQTSIRFPTENPRLLWAPLPGQDVWWRKHPRGAERAAQRGECVCVFSYLCVCKGLSMSVNICGKNLPEGPAVVAELSKTMKACWSGNGFQTHLCHSKQLNPLWTPSSFLCI